MITVKMYPARNGDAFLVKSTEPERAAVLIDGGYATTFDNYIRADLKDLAATGFRLNLVVCTHVDADHVGGLLRLFADNESAESPKSIGIDEVWHNSLRGLTFRQDAELSSADLQLLKSIQRRGFPVRTGSSPSEISARQGSSLAALLLKGGYCWNGDNGTTQIDSQADRHGQGWAISGVEVLAPSALCLDELRDWWLAGLRRLGFGGQITSSPIFDDAYEFALAHYAGGPVFTPKEIAHSASGERTLEEVYSQDVSVTNASSIAMILKLHGKSLLFLGDSRAEDVEAALRRRNRSGLPVIFDLIKVSHHGSFYNTSPSLLRIVDSGRYLISTDGTRHGLPDYEVLKEIVDRPAAFCRHLYFNYSTPASRRLRDYTSKNGTAFKVYEGHGDWITLN